MTRQEMIKRLRNCVIPSRYSQYPKKWYDSLTDAQLFRMCEEIEVDGPTEEEVEPTEEEVEQRVLEANCPTFPYRFNPENGDYEVYTESKQWEKVYD